MIMVTLVFKDGGSLTLPKENYVVRNESVIAVVGNVRVPIARVLLEELPLELSR